MSNEWINIGGLWPSKNGKEGTFSGLVPIEALEKAIQEGATIENKKGQVCIRFIVRWNDEHDEDQRKPAFQLSVPPSEEQAPPKKTAPKPSKPWQSPVQRAREAATANPAPSYAACRSCGEPILWESRNGKNHPTNPDGSSHFETCPQAAQWRKSQKAPSIPPPPDDNDVPF